ncbi:MAG: CHAT domain-containing protein, partial [Marinibacterium sp.]|nr:CHAT domain-containing protein [Marinibacterium sp.]
MKALTLAFLCLMPGALLALTPAEIRDNVFLTVQRASTSVAGKALQQAALRQMAGNADLAALLRRRQDLTDQQSAGQGALADAVARSGSEAEAQVAAAQTRLEQIRSELSDLDLQIEAAFPSFQELTNPRPMSRREVQATLRPDEALILTLTGPEEIFLWAVSKTRADWISVPIGTQDLDQRVRLLRSMLDVTADNRGAAALDGGNGDVDLSTSGPRFDRLVAHQLYMDLLHPLEHVFGNASHVITVVDGPLTSLPLSLLISSPPQGDDADPQALRETDWLITRYAMTTLPNVSSLRALRAVTDRPRVGDQQPFLGFGDPIFQYREDPGQATGIAEETDGYTSRGAFEAVTEVAGLAPLPGTARELRRLARITGVGEDALFLGQAATETTIKSTDLSRARILAFATHGLLTGELTGLDEPALVFTPPERPGPQDDALLTASEAAELK